MWGDFSLEISVHQKRRGQVAYDFAAVAELVFGEGVDGATADVGDVHIKSGRFTFSQLRASAYAA